MSEIRHVLAPIDLSDASPGVFAAAAALARTFDARLTALHVAPLDTTEPHLRAREDALRRFVTPEGGVWPLAAVEVRQGDPAQEIVQYARSAAADLIVTAVHARPAVERWIVGSVTEEVARQARCPVLAVPWAVRAPGFARVVCATDLSESSAETVAHAAEFARAVASPLVVLHVVDGPHGFEPWTVAGHTLDEARRALCADAQRRLQSLVAPYVAEGLDVEMRVAAGEPRLTLPEALGGADDLVVVGLRPSRGVDRFFYGSTAAGVLHQGTCPVLVVGHHARASAGPTVATAV